MQIAVHVVPGQGPEKIRDLSVRMPTPGSGYPAAPRREVLIPVARGSEMLAHVTEPYTDHGREKCSGHRLHFIT